MGEHRRGTDVSQAAQRISKRRVQLLVAVGIW